MKAKTEVLCAEPLVVRVPYARTRIPRKEKKSLRRMMRRALRLPEPTDRVDAWFA